MMLKIKYTFYWWLMKLLWNAWLHDLIRTGRFHRWWNTLNKKLTYLEKALDKTS